MFDLKEPQNKELEGNLGKKFHHEKRNGNANLILKSEYEIEGAISAAEGKQELKMALSSYLTNV